MPFSFHCESCQKKFTVSSKLVGKKIRCKGCSNTMRIPDPNDFVPIQTEWVVVCDDCGREHRPDEKLMGKRARCKCGAILHLSENPDAQIQLEPLDPEVVDPFALPPVTGDLNALTPTSSYQAPPPSFQKKSPATSMRESRRRDAEAMVRQADEKESWKRKSVKTEEDDDEWGAMGTIVGGVFMIGAGGLWSWLAWINGYVYPYSFILMVLGVVAIFTGIIKACID